MTIHTPPVNLHDSFRTYLTQRLETFEEPVSLYETFDFTLGDGGKMLRPYSVLLSGTAFGTHLDKLLPAALGVEFFHNFTLMHDDIMDHADLRRGKPSVVKKYGLNTAILSGDAMAIKAYEEILLAVKKCHADIKVIEDFNKMAISVCEGQQMDMDFEQLDEVRLESYIEMIGKKTASLFAFCLQCGASLSKIDRKTAMKLYRIGMNAGVAFQIQDDYLDFFGDMEKVGKIKGGDVLQGKKTALILTALEHASHDDRQVLLDILKTDHDHAFKIKTTSTLFVKYNIEEKVRILKDEYWTNALEEMDELVGDFPDLVHLKDFLFQLIVRNN